MLRAKKKNFARMVSDCVFRVGFSSFRKSIASFLWHQYFTSLNTLEWMFSLGQTVYERHSPNSLTTLAGTSLVFKWSGPSTAVWEGGETWSFPWAGESFVLLGNTTFLSTSWVTWSEVFLRTRGESCFSSADVKPIALWSLKIINAKN